MFPVSIHFTVSQNSNCNYFRNCRTIYLVTHARNNCMAAWSHINTLFQQKEKISTTVITIQCGAVITRWLFTKLVTIDTRRASYGVSFVSASPDISWWRHQMEIFSALLAICAGNSPVPVNSPHKGQWRGALMFSLICVWTNGSVNNREAGDLRRYRVHYDVTVICSAAVTEELYALSCYISARYNGTPRYMENHNFRNLMYGSQKPTS